MDLDQAVAQAATRVKNQSYGDIHLKFPQVVSDIKDEGKLTSFLQEERNTPETTLFSRAEVFF